MPPILGRPTVSVVIPAFNAESSIDAALESVFAQSYPDLDVVVVDDGSTDATAQRLEAWGERVRVIRQENGGPGRARNTGIRAASGSLIAFLDADDIWLPDKIERQVAYFEKYPQTGLLHTATLVAAAQRLPARADGHDHVEAVAPQHSFCQLFHTDVDVHTLTVMVPRAVLDVVGPFEERREIHVEDWDLWLRIAARYPVGYLACATAIHAVGGGMSSAFEKTFEGQAAVIRKTISLCELACPVHASQPAACLQRRWHRFYWERGYARLRAGDTRGARAAFLEALRHRPTSFGTAVQLVSTFAGPAVRQSLRRVRPEAPPVESPFGQQPSIGRPLLTPAAPGSQSADSAPDGTGSPSAGSTPRSTLARSLVHDTWYRRARHQCANLVHDLDDLVSRRPDRRRILFEAASPMSFAIYRPIHERLKRDPRFEFWFTVTEGTPDPKGLFAQVGIEERVLPTRAARWLKADVLINTDFYQQTWLHRRTRRVHLFHGVAGKYDLDAPVSIAPAVALSDRLFFPNEDRLRRYTEAGLVDPHSGVGLLIGYPKLDCLVDGSLNVAELACGLGLDSERNTVLYAPTWSPYSSLNAMGESLIDALADAGFNVIVKLHDRSRDLAPRASGGIDWFARLARYADHPLVHVVSGADATPFLAVADALVTDHSSVGFEFSLLNRPIVVVDCPQLIIKARVAPSKVAALRDAAEVVAEAREVVPALERQFQEPARHADARRALAATYFYRPGSATERAVAELYAVLGLERQPLPAESPQSSIALAEVRTEGSR